MYQSLCSNVIKQFFIREYFKNESIQAYAFDLKVLANKAYPNINLRYLENVKIYQLVVQQNLGEF